MFVMRLTWAICKIFDHRNQANYLLLTFSTFIPDITYITRFLKMFQWKQYTKKFPLFKDCTEPDTVYTNTTGCEKTCAQRTPSATCGQYLESGCICAGDLVRKDGVCVPVDDCDTCKINGTTYEVSSFFGFYIAWGFLNRYCLRCQS